MDRVQRSGLIALSVLIMTAVGAHLVGLRPGSEATIPPRVAVQDPSALESIEFLPPEQRRLFVHSESFRRAPVRNPLEAERGNDSTGPGALGELIDLEAPRVDPLPAPRPPVGRHADVVSSPGGEGRFAPPPRTTRVREGESLSQVSVRVYDTSRRWPEIAVLNALKEPFVVRTGQLLRLPEDGASQGTSVAGGGVAGSEAGGERGGVRSQPASAPRQYIVRNGDTPSEISQQVYGSQAHWRRILEHNRIRDPRLMKAGQVLEIPALPGE